jgi:hydroxyacylglutathione hydrolase
MALEKATNPFLRSHDSALAQAAGAMLKRPALDAVEVFAALRRAKDLF